MSENMEMDVEANSGSANPESHSSAAVEIQISTPNANAAGQGAQLKSVSSDHSEFDSSDDKDYFEIWSSGSSSQDSGEEDKMDVDGEMAAKRKKRDEQESQWEEMQERINNQELQDAIAEYPSEDSGGLWTNDENVSAKDKLTPLYCFQLFVNEAVLNLLVSETNKYARSKFIRPNYHKDFLTGWMDVTQTEMLELIGLLIFMKIRNLSGVKYYWSCDRDMVTPIAGYVMTETRFKRLMSFWRFGEEPGAQFSKISNLLKLLNDNFGRVKAPAPVMYVGKSTVYLREHYAKQKRGEGVSVRGHKVLRVVDNHLYTFKVCLAPPERPAQPTVAVLKLLEDYLDADRIFVFDNLFISVEIAEAMRKRNSFVLGPIRRKSHGTPDKFNALKFHDNEIRGFEHSHCGVGVYKWKINESKSCVLGTCRGRGASQANQPDQKQEKTPSLSTTDFLKYYESRLELFELVEQYSIPDSPINSETTWYRRLASDLLTGVCVSNAYLYYKKFSNDKKCPYYKFQDHLWKQLVGFTWLLEGETSGEEG